MSLPVQLESCSRRPGATEIVVARAEHDLGCRLPPDYKKLLFESNGFEGPVGAESYIAMWPVEMLREANDGYQMPELAPGIVLLGSNGGGDGYGFRMRGPDYEYVSLPLIGLEVDDEVSSSFVEFLEKLP
jgi:hypothetical protein